MTDLKSKGNEEEKVNGIGGFFELELPKKIIKYHSHAMALTNARACLSWILEREKPKRLIVPFYSCFAVFAPALEMNVSVEFYHVDESLSPVNLPELGNEDFLLVINYFGMQESLARSLVGIHGRKVIVDNTHAFFQRGYKDAYSFTTARKYFGVPDGAYLYGADGDEKLIERNCRISIKPNLNRLLGKQSKAYADYQAYEDTLNCEISRISILSEILLSNIDYEAVKVRRRENFKFLHDSLGDHNRLELNFESEVVPFCYPFLPSQVLSKKSFHDVGLFVPTLWPDLLERPGDQFDFERDLARRLLPLPIDHRYDKVDMQKIIDFMMLSL